MGAAVRAAAAACLRVGLLLLAALGAGGAHAAEDFALVPSSLQQCLVPVGLARANPVYPEAMLAQARGGTLQASFTFLAADQPPEVTFSRSPDGDFEQAVLAYSKQLRVPCLGGAGAKVTLLQTFDFAPNEGRKVTLTVPRDAAHAYRDQDKGCVTHRSQYDVTYPREMVAKGQEGNVVMRLRFADTATPPEFELLDDGGSKLFVKAVKEHLQDMRLACVGSGPVEVNIFFYFRLEGGRAGRTSLGDLDLASFLKAVKPVRPGSAYFDTTSMQCPFDVRVTLRQPWDRNKVEVLGADAAEREVFLDWLAGLEVRVDPGSSNAMLGRSIGVHVPCAAIDL